MKHFHFSSVVFNSIFIATQKREKKTMCLYKMKCNHEVTIDGVSYQHNNGRTDGWRKERMRLRVLGLSPEWFRTEENELPEQSEQEGPLTKEDTYVHWEAKRENAWLWRDGEKQKGRSNGIEYFRTWASLNAEGKYPEDIIWMREGKWYSEKSCLCGLFLRLFTV